MVLIPAFSMKSNTTYRFADLPASIATTDQDDNDSSSSQLSGIPKPHKNDVLMGRGGKNNKFQGNEKLRMLARDRVVEYAKASKKGKSEISRELVRIVRQMKPPGRCVQQLVAAKVLV